MSWCLISISDEPLKSSLRLINLKKFHFNYIKFKCQDKIDQPKDLFCFSLYAISNYDTFIIHYSQTNKNDLERNLKHWFKNWFEEFLGFYEIQIPNDFDSKLILKFDQTKETSDQVKNVFNCLGKLMKYDNLFLKKENSSFPLPWSLFNLSELEKEFSNNETLKKIFPSEALNTREIPSFEIQRIKEREDRNKLRFVICYIEALKPYKELMKNCHITFKFSKMSLKHFEHNFLLNEKLNRTYIKIFENQKQIQSKKRKIQV